MSRKSAILAAATDLFAEKGFNETCTAEIAARAGVAQGTLFYHFKSKEGVLLEVFADVMGAYLHGQEQALQGAGDGRAALEEMLRFHFRFLKDNSRHLLVLIRDFPCHLLREDCPRRSQVREKLLAMIALLRTCLERGAHDGSLRVEDPQTTALLLRGLLSGLTRQQLLSPLDVPDLGEEAVAFCLEALRPDGSPAPLAT
ncbi:TetR/AcrR family transcriptional regulator [Geoalkalibacter halelectricus]|uniref:TetR/AcrR family transcriptional regulator n=1 Tax=Geoalkalibacter halelectricus TaxID=2847045 RepID=UPI003D1DAA4C